MKILLNFEVGMSSLKFLECFGLGWSLLGQKSLFLTMASKSKIGQTIRHCGPPTVPNYSSSFSESLTNFLCEFLSLSRLSGSAQAWRSQRQPLECRRTASRSRTTRAPCRWTSRTRRSRASRSLSTTSPTANHRLSRRSGPLRRCVEQEVLGALASQALEEKGSLVPLFWLCAWL